MSGRVIILGEKDALYRIDRSDANAIFCHDLLGMMAGHIDAFDIA